MEMKLGIVWLLSIHKNSSFHGSCRRYNRIKEIDFDGQYSLFLKRGLNHV